MARLDEEATDGIPTRVLVDASFGLRCGGAGRATGSTAWVPRPGAIFVLSTRAGTGAWAAATFFGGGGMGALLTLGGAGERTPLGGGGTEGGFTPGGGGVTFTWAADGGAGGAGTLEGAGGFGALLTLGGTGALLALGGTGALLALGGAGLRLELGGVGGAGAFDTAARRGGFATDVTFFAGGALGFLFEGAEGDFELAPIVPCYQGTQFSQRGACAHQVRLLDD